MLKGLVVFGLARRPIVLLALLVFVGAGIAAFFKLNIEAYPNPAPVILEITAQAPGQSAEEMERYYTIPMEVGLSTTPGVDVIRSTSFYGLSFVRVTFNYGIDYYFAVQQAALSLQQNVSLPNNVSPQIQASSLVGEVFRYQVVGPPHFGLTNLRTTQDWVLQRRFLTVPGVVQVNTWGGATKEYEVEVDLNKLDAYNITIPQMIAAIGNANTNVGGRTINMGQQSIFHERNLRYIPIKFSVRGRDLGSTVAEAQARIARNVPLPNGYRILWAGEFEELQQAKARLAIVVPISLMMILVLLYGLFNSLRDSLLALAGIPFSIAGGVIALFVTGLDFSISAAIGFVSLFGVSVMNGILIITYYNQTRVGGMGAIEAMYHAAEQRMRPMLMTALSACIGLLPAAISTGIGSQVQLPVATVVVGGMLIGPVIMLVVVPALQTLVLDWPGSDREAVFNEDEPDLAET